MGSGEIFGLGHPFWVRVKNLVLGENFKFGVKILGSVENFGFG